MAATTQQLRARLFRRFRGVEVGWVPCVACGAQLHHSVERKANPSRFEVMTVVDVAGGWRTSGCLPLCAVDAPVVASWSRDETVELLAADHLDSPVEAHGTARARTMRVSDASNVAGGAVIVPEVEGFLARRETLSGVVRWSIDGLTVDPDTVHALTASAGTWANPYHGPDGRFAPKGTGSTSGVSMDDLAAGKTVTVSQADLSPTVMAMAADGRKLNLANVHVQGTQAFDDNLGVSRADMPQIPADHKQQFLSELSGSGVTVHSEQIPAGQIRSTQGEIDPVKVAGFIGHLDPAQIRASPLLVSSDGYMLDGHHRWAAQVADGSNVTAQRIGLSARDALPVMADFNRRNGIEARGFTIGEWTLDEWSNPYRDARGRYAPKGTQGGAGWQSLNGGRPGMGDVGVPTRESILADGGPDVPHSLLAHMTADGQFTPERQALHDKIVASQLDHLRPAGPPPPVITFLGGGGGAGKSSAIKQGIVPERKGSATVNADDYKMMLPEAISMSEAGDASWAGITHEESSYLAKRVRTAALERHLDVTVDAVGSNPGRVAEQTAQARTLGYTTHVSYVTLPVETGLARAQSRADNMAARGETPRVIRADVLRRAHDGANHAFPQAAMSSDVAQLIDNGGTGPRLIATRRNGTWEITDRAAWSEYLARAGSQPADITSLTVARLATMKLEVTMEEEVSLKRLNQLSMALSCGIIPTNMTPAEQTAYEAMKVEQDANPGVVYMPITEDF